MGGTFAHSARTGGSRAQGGVASCVRCRGCGVGGRACPRGAGCAGRDRDRSCARRTGAIHLPRQAVLLVSLRMGGRRLVLVRLWHLCRRRLGRHLWLERLGRAATLPRRAGRTAIPLLARALSTPPCRRRPAHQPLREQRGDGEWAPPLRLSRRLLVLAGEQRGRKLRRITTLLRRTRMVFARARVRLHDPTSRSTSSGNATTLTINTVTANRKPTKLPTMMSIQPDGVVKT